jgi:hypothetical protein
VRGLEPLTSGLQSPRSAKLSYTPVLSIWLRGRDLNPRPLGYAYHYSFRCPVGLWSGLSLHPQLFKMLKTVRVPAIKSLHLL